MHVLTSAEANNNWQTHEILNSSTCHLCTLILHNAVREYSHYKTAQNKTAQHPAVMKRPQPTSWQLNKHVCIYSCHAKRLGLLDVQTHQGEVCPGPSDFEGDFIRKHRRSCTICRHTDQNQPQKPTPKHPHRPCWASKSAIGTLERDSWRRRVRNTVTTGNQWDLIANWLLIVWLELKQEAHQDFVILPRPFPASDGNSPQPIAREAHEPLLVLLS